ncbi:1-phosphofructokinase [Acinetobacter sp. ABJ_C3_5]|uniref:1-phosphofructokinase n=1 Tax=Acinetobacter courvalinii TaxID=280147 RepID=UPI0037C6A5DE
MAKILTITLNPAIDVTLELDELRVGEVNRQQQVQSHAAGKGLNVAQVLHDLGHELIVSGFLGKQNRALFEQHFQAMQFDNQFVYVEGETRQNIKIAEQSGRMTDINAKGFRVSEQDKQAFFARIQACSQHVDYVVIAGSLAQGFSIDDFKYLISILHKQHKHVAIDSSGQALVAAIEMNPWMIKPNTDELQESFGEAAENFSQQLALFQRLNCQIEHIVISMGEAGVNWINPVLALHASPPQVPVKSTVGAGDSLLAGMVHGLVSNMTAEQTLKTATAIASHAVTQVGFRVPEAQRLEALKQQTIINTLDNSDANN